ncbi:MAG: D-aminoacyl-tRNA deacylase [Clostridiales bacterium]|nr:D-tyrosyl-tRNA(Tyr) deacylase [Oscillospiraceae bacterium]MDD5905235.1 D-aminoacyl-tRNA deacylase [Clostridiales bacterium]
MRAVLTRVKHASVTIDGQVKGRIGEGFLILLGVTHDDTEAQAVKLADKLTSLRIFEDEDGKMNRGLEVVNGEILVVSQFTLYGNCKKGRRPDFLAAARPEIAIPLYEKFVAVCRDKGFHVETGEFGAYMEVESLNDGPLTLVVDTDQL